MTRRIAILASSGLMAARLAQALGDCAQVAKVDESTTTGNVPMPSLNFASFADRSAAPSPSGKTHKGKRVAQWKQERSRR